MSHAARLIERHQGKEAMSFLGKLPRARLALTTQADILELEGEALQQLGEFRQADLAYRSCLRLSKKLSDSWRVAETAQRLGDIARQLERFHDALRWYRTVETDAKALKSERLRLDALSGRAMALRGLGKYREALDAFSRLLQAYRRRRDTEGVAYVLWAMGTTERFAGWLADADRHLRLAVGAYRRLKDASGLAYALCGWGGTLRMRGLAKQSGRLYAQANLTFRRQNDQFGIAYSSCGQGNALRMQGLLKRAIPFMARAEKGYRALKLHGPLGFVLWSRSQLRIAEGNFSAARLQLAQARAAFKAARDPRGLVYVELGEGELAAASDRDPKPFYRRAATHARKLSLSFEWTHARVRSGVAKTSIYRACGVSARHFSKYRALP